MQSLGFPSNWIVRPVIVLLAFAIALYLGAGLILQYWKVGIGISKAQRNDTDYSSGKEKMTCRSLDEVRTITIRLDNYTLDIQKRNVRLSNITKLSILKPLNTVFEPGVLNVIMGPSGSGKTYVFSEFMFPLLNPILSLETCLGSIYSLDVFSSSLHPLKQARLTPK